MKNAAFPWPSFCWFPGIPCFGATHPSKRLEDLAALLEAPSLPKKTELWPLLAASVRVGIPLDLYQIYTIGYLCGHYFD
jgi:hypothetical protein